MRRAPALAAILCAGAAWSAEASRPAPEPKITSVFPSAGAPGATFEAAIRGAGLAGARSVLGVGARLLDASSDTEIKVSFAPGAAGIHRFRVVTPFGATNEAEIHAVGIRTIREGEPVHELPVLINGTIARRGEVDSYWIDARAGETIRFDAESGFAGFDPSLTLWAPAATWFDGERLERVAMNDDPLSFPGLATDAVLIHRFARDGRYCLKVGAFGGAGGADYVYRLRIARGQGPPVSLRPPLAREEWPERWFTRALGPEWPAAIARRGLVKPPGPIETYRAVPEGSSGLPVIDNAGLVEGRLARAGEAHEIRFRIAEPRDLAIEVETPEATLPRFNPVVRLMQPDGHEIVTNVYTKRNNNGLYMMKMIQAKTTVTLRSVGEYRLQIRDITSDCWSPDFAYRVLIRPQVPHLGAVKLVEDRVNLEPGQSKPLTVNIDREEGFKGFVAVSVEGLPPGVTAVTGLENPVEKPPLPNAGRRERYYPVPQTATVMLAASEDATPMDSPVAARVAVRPVVNGRMGDAVLKKEIPVMVVARRPS